MERGCGRPARFPANGAKWTRRSLFSVKPAIVISCATCANPFSKTTLWDGSPGSGPSGWKSICCSARSARSARGAFRRKGNDGGGGEIRKIQKVERKRTAQGWSGALWVALLPGMLWIHPAQRKGAESFL